MTEWTPKPGELTVDTDTDMTHCEGVWRYVRDVKTSSFPNMCRRLLPAVTTAEEAWEALCIMAHCPGEEMSVMIPLETGHIRIEGVVDFIKPLQCEWQEDNDTIEMTDEEIVEMMLFRFTDEFYAARGRDYQKEGAIREWLKQVKQ